jgi:hypothetical protein
MTNNSRSTHLSALHRPAHQTWNLIFCGLSQSVVDEPRLSIPQTGDKFKTVSAYDIKLVSGHFLQARKNSDVLYLDYGFHLIDQ